MMEPEFVYYALLLVAGIAFGYGISAFSHWIKTRGGGW